MQNRKFVSILRALALSPLLFSANLWANSTSSLAFNLVRGQDLLSEKPIEIKAEQIQSGLVLVFLGVNCPCSNSHEEYLQKLAKNFPEFRFVAIHANSDESHAQTIAHFRKSPIQFSVIEDQDGRLANTLKAFKTPHAYLINKNGLIAYQGGVTDSHVASQASRQLLAEVLTDVKEGREPRIKEGRTLGCAIARK